MTSMSQNHALKVLAQDQIDQFIEDGYTILRQAFSPETAAAIRACLWDELADLGVHAQDPASWTKPLVHLPRTFANPPYSDVWTEKVYAAFDDVMGEGRYLAPVGLGWWPVSFPGFDSLPWLPPTTGWHIDGIQFHHNIDSADQGLLPLFIFSDILPYGGGTAVSAGSHRITARILRDAEPDGLDVDELTRRVLEHPRTDVRELTGSAGDVVLVHPFVLHARSANTGTAVRFICNPCIPLKETMNLARTSPADYSPVELAIVQALAK